MRLYQEELMDHYRHPRNKGAVTAPDFVGEDHNPSCGDRVQVSGKFDGSTVTELCFEAKGCVLSQASASMLTEICMGKNCTEIAALSKEDVLELVGVPLGPNRVKCALLFLFVLQEAILSSQR